MNALRWRIFVWSDRACRSATAALPTAAAITGASQYGALDLIYSLIAGQFYRIVGSADVIDSSVGQLTNITSGVVGIFYGPTRAVSWATNHRIWVLPWSREPRASWRRRSWSVRQSVEGHRYHRTRRVLKVRLRWTDHLMTILDERINRTDCGHLRQKLPGSPAHLEDPQ